MTLAEQRVGDTWLDLDTTNLSSTDNVLNSVSCHTTTTCTAVGQYDNGSGTGLTLAEYWDGSAWTTQNTPDPGSSQDATLTGVSCALTANCTAVGSWVLPSGVTRVLAEQWNGTKWVIQAPINPNGYRLRHLTGVSCALPATCTAVGWIEHPSTGAIDTLAEAN